MRSGKPFKRTSLSLGTDLRERRATAELFARTRPTHVINCAAFVGGIQFGYRYPARIFRDNLQMTINLLAAAEEHDVRRIVNPISNCAYPARSKVFREEEFWDGPLHESVLVYGFVRKAFWVGSWAYAQQFQLDVINLILSNMYGPGDHFDEERSHALGALVMKIVEAKRSGANEVVVWGSGNPVREWLHVDDGAEALVRALDVSATLEPVNIGVKSGIAIRELAERIKAEVGYGGRLVFDTSKPDGAEYKTVDGSRGEALLGWKPRIDLDEGIRQTIQWYVAQSD